MLSKSLIQFSVDGQGCVLSLLFDLRPQQEVMKIMGTSVPPTMQQATVDPRLHQRLLDTHGQVVGSLLLSPGSWCTRFCCALQESISQSCVNSGSSMLLLLSHFSHLTLCDPIDSSPPSSPIPGILLARTLEWVAISFGNA